MPDYAPSASMSSGSSQVGSVLTTASRRNSFDVVVNVLNTHASNDAPNIVAPNVPSSTVNESCPYWARGPFAPRSRDRQPVDIESQAETFEMIDLTEWPRESRLGATNPAVAAFAPQPPPPLPRQIIQQPETSNIVRQAPNAPSPAPMSRTSDLNAEIGLWDDLVAMFGAMLTGKIAMNE